MSTFCDRHQFHYHGDACPRCHGQKEPPPLTANDLGALYTSLEFTMTMSLGALDQDALHRSAMLLDRVRSHYIAAGGNPKDLEDPV